MDKLISRFFLIGTTLAMFSGTVWFFHSHPAASDWVKLSAQTVAAGLTICPEPNVSSHQNPAPEQAYCIHLPFIQLPYQPTYMIKLPCCDQRAMHSNEPQHRGSSKPAEISSAQ